MKSHKKKFFLLCLIIWILFTSGCSSPQKGVDSLSEFAAGNDAVNNNSAAYPKSRDTIISFVPKSLDNPVFLDAKEEAERVCKELGVKFEWLGPMQTDSREQELIVESLIRRKVDGIVISCVDPGRMKKVIDKAVDAGIKVATFDSDSPDSKRLFYCGTNNYAAGKACGTELEKILEWKKKGKEELKVLVMTADKGSFNLNERLRGFEETTKNSNIRLEVIDTLYCQDDINIAGEILEGYMRNNEDVDIFFSTGGWPLIVPSDSMPRFQRWCKNDGISIVIDTFYPMVVAAKKGMADALVGQNFKKMGELSVRNLYRAIKGESIHTYFIDTGLELGNSENYDILLQSKKSWEIK